MRYIALALSLRNYFRNILYNNNSYKRIRRNCRNYVSRTTQTATNISSNQPFQFEFSMFQYVRLHFCFILHKYKRIQPYLFSLFGFCILLVSGSVKAVFPPTPRGQTAKIIRGPLVQVRYRAPWWNYSKIVIKGEPGITKKGSGKVLFLSRYIGIGFDRKWEKKKPHQDTQITCFLYTSLLKFMALSVTQESGVLEEKRTR